MKYVKCTCCKEPWDKEDMRHNEIWETKLPEFLKRNWDGILTEEIELEFEEIGWEFNGGVLDIKYCPLCPEDLRIKKKSAREIIEEIMED